jgi:hypothetical protein
MASVADTANSFLVLRTSKLVEVVGPGADDSLLIDERPGTRFFFLVSDPLCLSSFLALHFFR